MSTSHTSFKAVEKEILQFLDGTQIFNPRFFYKPVRDDARIH
jgi:hypothetical protein